MVKTGGKVIGKNFTVENEFYCTQCGRRGFSIPRKVGKEREAGHLKKIYCLNCHKEQNFVECKPFTKYDKEDFIIEYEYGNFNEKGQRIRTYGELRSLINNGKIEKKKTFSDDRNPGFR